MTQALMRRALTEHTQRTKLKPDYFVVGRLIALDLHADYMETRKTDGFQELKYMDIPVYVVSFFPASAILTFTEEEFKHFKEEIDK